MVRDIVGSGNSMDIGLKFLMSIKYLKVSKKISL